MSLQSFKDSFPFAPDKAGLFGVERECFLLRNGRIVPIAPLVLGEYAGPDFSHELSSCQFESKVGPLQIGQLAGALRAQEAELTELESRYAFTRSFDSVAPADMPLDIYPDPRYQRIAATMSPERLLAACRIVGTHFHVGMTNHEAALRAHNIACEHAAELCELGNPDGPERLEIYRIVAPKCDPVPYADWQAFYQHAFQEGFAEDPRANWCLVRLTCHGTVEFRMFGATASIKRIVDWATRCAELCALAY